MSGSSLKLRLKYPNERLYVPSEFLYHPSKEGETLWPLSCGIGGSCTCPCGRAEGMAARAATTAALSTIRRILGLIWALQTYRRMGRTNCDSDGISTEQMLPKGT